MARLNEIAAPTESIEALKRRFVRQNREIARANSVQSLRIRTLESDVSRLLAENISLRERIITLDQEVEKFNSVPFLGDGVDEVKGKLAAKLEELGTLVTELGSLPKIMKKPPASVEQPEDGERQTTLDRPTRRRAMALFDGDGFDDGRLPVIMEDKYYPRKTLDSQEVRDVLQENFDAESPDIGPPPIAHFDTLDSTSPNLEEAFKRSRILDDEIHDTSELPPNLETRKKKRDVLFLTDDDWKTDEEPRSEFLKPGSKRKLSVRDDEERMPQSLDEFDDFQYNLPTTKPREETTKVKLEHAPRISAAKAKGSPLKGEETAVRKPLGQKSTNTNPSSPKKRKQPQSVEKEVDPKAPAPKPSKPREQKTARKRVTAEPSTKSKQRRNHEDIPFIMPEERCLEPVNVELPPKTPAVDDILSPNLTEPSVSRQKSRDTPPPSDLTSLTPGALGLNAETRPSRRPRAAVSYAEPSLRGKMRRSTKEFTDAVVGEDRFRRSSQIERVDSEEPPSGEDRRKVRTVSVKREEPDDYSWKTLATAEKEAEHEKDFGSPLGAKSGSHPAELPSSVMTNRKRRTLSSNTFDLPEGGPSSSSIAISTLVAGSRRPSHSRRLKDETNFEKETAVDIENDHSASSYGDLGTSSDNLPTTRQSRRHSSKPTNLLQENAAPPAPSRFADSFDDHIDTRREEDDNFTFSRLAETGTEKAKKGERDVSRGKKRGESAARSKRDSSIDSLNASESSQVEGQATRGQRAAASRRRSMMV